MAAVPEGGKCGDRLTAELLGLTCISKGFTRWGFGNGSKTYKLTVVEGDKPGKLDRARLLEQVPKTPGIYVWCARAPDAGHSQWFAVYLGKANKLRDRLGAYINSDGTFGPQKEAHKLGVLKEMYEKGFDFQIRWRGIRQRAAAADEANKLAKYNFPLNQDENGGYRPVLVPRKGLIFAKPPVGLADFPKCRVWPGAPVGRPTR